MSDIVFGDLQGAPQVRRWDRHAIRSALKPVAAAFGLVAAVTLLVAAVRSLPTPAPAAATPAVEDVQLPAWRGIMRPVRIFSLQAPEFAGAASSYVARVHAPDGGREDVLTLGQFDGDKPALRMRIFRAASGSAPAEAFDTALEKETSDLGLTLAHAGRPTPVATRIGRYDVARVALALPGGGERSCAGFQLALDKPALAIVGLACNRSGAVLTRTSVGCLLERLDVASARDDRALIDFFAASQLKRNAACKGARLGPDSLHAAWLDEKPAPAKPARSSGKGATGGKTLRRH